MITISPVDLVLRVAAATVGACEVGPNAGPYVERVLRRTGNPKGDPWCAAWVTDVGVTALEDAWPCKRSASVAEIVAWSQRTGCSKVPNKEGDGAPKVGDAFALYFPALKRHAHIGFVVGVNPDGSIRTVEGNTNAGGSRDGWLVAVRERKLTVQDRLIRWAEVIT